MSQGEVMIQVDDLTKSFGSTHAVDGISFSVRQGEVLGFLGPNGAGKTTTMRILTCFLGPTSGRASVAGFDVWTRPLEVRQKVGYLPEDTPLYRDMSVLEYLDFVVAVRQLPRSGRRKRIKEICEQCSLMEVLGRNVGELSRGYRQRVGIAQALVHDPEVLVLDEPTSGLDPNQIVEIRTLIKEIGRTKTVILSTHILPEVQATCGRVIIISDGKLVADGTPEELRRQDQGSRYQLVVVADGKPEAELAEQLTALEGVAHCTAAPAEDGAVRFTVEAKGSADLRRPLFRLAVDSGWTLLELHRLSASLEDVFRKLTTQDN